MANARQLLTVLKLDDASFQKGMSSSAKLALSFSAGAAAGVTAAVALAKRTADTNDRMIKAARTAGVLSDEYSKLSVAANFSGVSQEQLTKGLQKLSAQSDTTKKELSKLGISLTDMNGNTKSAKDLMYDVADAIQSAETPAQKTAVAVRVFGEEGARMVNMLSSGSEGLKDFATQAENLGLVVSENAGVSAEKFNDDMARLGMAVDGLSNTVGQSIIEFVNQSNAINEVTAVVTDAIKWVKNLDDDTKDWIVIIGQTVVALAGLTTGIYATKTALLATSSAVKNFILGLNPILALAAAPVIITILVLKKKMDEEQARIQRFKEEIDKLGEESPQKLKQLQDSFAGLAKATGSVEALRNQAFQTKQSFADMATSMGVSSRVAQEISGNYDSLQKFIKLSDEKLKEFNKTAADTGDILKTIPEDSPKLNPQKIVQATSALDQFNGMATKVSGTISTVTGVLSQLAEASAAAIKKQFDSLIYNADLFSQLYSKKAQEDLDAYVKAEEDRLEKLRASEAAQLKAIEDSENQKIKLLERARLERELMYDEEYQKRKELEEERFQEYLLSERERYDERFAQIDEANLTLEEKRATKAAMEASWDEYEKMLNQEHTANLESIAKEFENQRTANNQQYSDQIKAQKDQSDAYIEQKTQLSNSLIGNEEERFAKEREARQKKKEAAEKRHQKAITLIQWAAEKTAFEQTKNTQIAQTVASGIAGAAQVFAGTAGLFPPWSLVLAAVLAAGVVAATNASVQGIRGTQIQPPASLFLNTGGVLRSDMNGGPQSGDTVPAMLTPGEAVLDSDATRKIGDFVDAGLSGGGVTVIFENGAIQNRGDMTDRAIDQLTKQIAFRLQREAALG